MTDQDPRFKIEGNNVFFPKVGLVFHNIFIRRFNGVSIRTARWMLRQNWEHAAQDEIIHFLKEKKIITENKHWKESIRKESI